MTIAKYSIGFVLSLILTLVAYFVVVGGYRSQWLLGILAVLAIIQMVVQLVFFLHLGDETGPRMKLASFLFMAGTLLIIVGGSLWIMQNLNYNMINMTAGQKDGYMAGKNEMSF